MQENNSMAKEVSWVEPEDHEALYQHDFFIVSPRKLMVLTMATMGLYSFYWLYVQWRAWKKRTGEDVWPLARAIFNVFFMHSLLRKINEWACERGGALANHRNLAWGWVVLSLVAKIAYHLLSGGTSKAMSFVIALLIIGVVTAILNMVQKTINQVSGDETGASNADFSFANWLWIVIGLLLWAGLAPAWPVAEEPAGSSGPAII